MRKTVISNLQPVEDGVYDIPLWLESPLEPQRPQLKNSVLSAQRRLHIFAEKYLWHHHLQKSFARETRFYYSKTKFDHDLQKLCNIDPILSLPKTYCATLEKDILMCVSPAIYRDVYPEGIETDSYIKLLIHEMAHRLHIRILDGNEDAMGPVWFYEGFAILAAGQFESSAPELTTDEIWKIATTPERGSYRCYATVIRYFLQRISLQKMVKLAGTDAFMQKLPMLFGL